MGWGWYRDNEVHVYTIALTLLVLKSGLFNLSFYLLAYLFERQGSTLKNSVLHVNSMHTTAYKIVGTMF